MARWWEDDTGGALTALLALAATAAALARLTALAAALALLTVCKCLLVLLLLPFPLEFFGVVGLLDLALGAANALSLALMVFLGTRMLRERGEGGLTGGVGEADANESSSVGSGVVAGWLAAWAAVSSCWLCGGAWGLLSWVLLAAKAGLGILLGCGPCLPRADPCIGDGEREKLPPELVIAGKLVLSDCSFPAEAALRGPAFLMPLAESDLSRMGGKGCTLPLLTLCCNSSTMCACCRYKQLRLATLVVAVCLSRLHQSHDCNVEGQEYRVCNARHQIAGRDCLKHVEEHYVA